MIFKIEIALSARKSDIITMKKHYFLSKKFNIYEKELFDIFL